MASEPAPITSTRRPVDGRRQDLLGGRRPDVAAGRVLITAAHGFDGYEIMQYHGVAWGVSIRAKDFGQDCFMGCKNFTGGELSSYAQLGDETRQRAIDRMLDGAKRQGANAIIGFTFHMQMSAHGSAEVVAHGTAVTIRPIPNYVPTGAIGTILAEIAERHEA